MSMDVVLDATGEEIILYFDIETESLDAQTFWKCADSPRK
jgi:hypothetical protein